MNRNIILMVFFVSGFAALVYEIVWTRLFSLILGATTYSFAIVLAAFLLGLAIGSYFIGRKFSTIQSPIMVFAAVEILIGLFGLAILLVFNHLDLVYLRLHSLFNAFGPFMVSLAFLVFGILIIPTALMGMTLPLAAKIFSQENKLGIDLGKIFSVNVFGAILGSLAAGFVLIPGIGHAHAIALASSLNILAGFILFVFCPRFYPNRNKYFYLLFTISIVLLVFTVFTFKIDVKEAGVYHRPFSFDADAWKATKATRNVLFVEENAYGFVSVDEEEGHYRLRINGKTEGGTHPSDLSVHLMLGYIPMVMHSNPREILHIGLGTGTTLVATAHFNEAERIDVVELNPAIANGAKLFAELNENVLENPKVNLFINDARNHLLLNEKKYDVIILEPSDIWLSGEVNLFTKEFYEIVKSRLNKKGIFVTWIPASELSTEDTAIALKTISSVFPYTKIFSVGTTLILVNSNELINMDFDRFNAKIFSNPTVLTNMNSISAYTFNGTAENYFAQNFQADEALIAGIQAPINTDNFPTLEFRTIANNAYPSNNTLIVRGAENE